MHIEEKNIIWDWNGTLLNDTAICISVMNDMLLKRGMDILDIGYYREVFGFPVKEYYRKLGFDFDKESFESLSKEFIDNYTHQLLNANLAHGAELVLKHFRAEGKKNIILSAMQQDMLISSIQNLRFESFFSDILGIDDIYAHSKSALAVAYLKKNKLKGKDFMLIGDTLHDYEVATEIGCKCILVADGHQSEKRLRETGAIVVDSLESLLNGIV
jgi:phosphoglycolate phosphatase